jgi:poly(3-hydroxybutyrate) depolymerase
MIYHAYSTHASILDFIRPLVGAVGRTLRLPWPLGPSNWSARKLAGVLETFADLMVTHVRPPFGIDSVDIDDCPVSVTEKAAYATPFATLLRFKKETGAAQPRVLLVAPMSGHFATLLRATARTMLVDHDVYITDWHNARDVPVAEGRFDFSDFVDHVIKFLRIMGPGTHVVAVYQPCVPVLAAAALMAQDGDAAQPRSMTYGGPYRYANQSDKSE